MLPFPRSLVSFALHREPYSECFKDTLPVVAVFEPNLHNIRNRASYHCFICALSLYLRLPVSSDTPFVNIYDIRNV